MLVLLSPSKTLNFTDKPTSDEFTTPRMLKKSTALINTLQNKSPSDIANLMSVSSKIAILNSERFQSWKTPFTLKNAKQAIFAFQGDVYEGLNASSLSKQDIVFSQKHLRILSGLYGVLRPLDLMQAYRLEMGTKLDHGGCNNLYDYWDMQINTIINNDLKKIKSDTIINLSSMEYFKAFQPSSFNGRIITPIFKDTKNGKEKIISFYAKKARGLMSHFIIKNKISNPKDIREFNVAGYEFNNTLSTDNELLFIRTEQAAKKQSLVS